MTATVPPIIRMKLFDVPPGSRIHVGGIGGNEYLFVKLDGGFSVCKDDQGHIAHLFATTEVEIIN